MQLRVVIGIEDGQQNQARRADQREQHRQGEQDLLEDGDVGYQAAAVPEPALRHERQVQGDGNEA